MGDRAENGLKIEPGRLDLYGSFFSENKRDRIRRTYPKAAADLSRHSDLILAADFGCHLNYGNPSETQCCGQLSACKAIYRFALQ